MKDDNKTTGIVLGCYYVTLLMFLLGALYPEGRIWGFNLWSFLPESFKYILFGIGVVFPFVINKFFKNNISIEDANNSDKTYWLVSSVVVIIFGLSFYILRAQTFFLGDGYQNLANLTNENNNLIFKAFGERLLHLLVFNSLEAVNEQNALLSFQILSILSGVIFIIIVAFFAAKYFENNKIRFLFLIGVITGGYTLMSFGYVEYYSLFLLSLSIFTLVGIQISRNKLNRWFIFPAWLITIFFHIFGIVLFPAFLYCLISNTKISHFLNNRRIFSFSMAIIILSVIGYGFFYLYTNYYFFRFSFVPFYQDSFAFEGYTLFSQAHLLDIVNLLFLLIPGLLVFVGVLILGFKKEYFKNRVYIFLIILIISTLGAVFIFDPKLGMPRDWDLFSFSGIPITIIVYYFLLKNNKYHKNYITIVFLLIILSLISLTSRAIILSNPDFGVTQFLSYYELDKLKNRTGLKTLGKYCYNSGQTQKTLVINNKLDMDFPEEKLVEKAIISGLGENVNNTISLLKRVLKKEPTHWNAWTNLSVCYNSIRKFDSALYCLKIADGLNPSNNIILAKHGEAYYGLKDYSNAKKYFLVSIDLGNTDIITLILLLQVYRITNQSEEFDKLALHIVSRDDVKKEFIENLIQYYVSNNKSDKAREIYIHTADQGIDSLILKR